MVGADICGFIGDATAELCQRWMQLGAFYPFSRNHNAGSIDQDPGNWGPQIAESNRKVLMIRYTLLPYLYTLFFEQGTVARALWHEFPQDPETWGIDKQFMWGSGLLITPVLEENQTEVTGYLPEGRFYDYYTGAEEPRPRNGNWVTWLAPLDHINLHVKGGTIIPTQEPAVNTEISRNNPFGLIVALDEKEEAFGKMSYDDGETIGTVERKEYFLVEKISVRDNTLSWNVTVNGYTEMAEKTLNTIRLLGVSSGIKEMKVNGEVHSDWEEFSSGEIFISTLGLNPTNNFTVSWQ